MAMSLFHGSRERVIIQDIDVTKGKRAKEAAGFNTSPYANESERYAGFTDKDMQGGFVYRIDLTEKDAADAKHFDNYNYTNGQKWLVNSAPVDESLVQRLASSMKNLGQSGKHDFAQGAADLERRFQAGHLADYSTRQLVEQIQNTYDVPRTGNAGQKTSLDVFRGAGIAGIHVQTNSSVVIFDPDAVAKPLPHAFFNPNNADASAVGGILQQLNQTQGLPGSLDRSVRLMVAQATIDTEDNKPTAFAGIQAVRGVLDGAGVPLSQGLKDQLDKAEDASARAAGITPEKLAEMRVAQQRVKERPARQEGEAFHAYKDRVFADFDTKYPAVSEGQKQAFNGAFHDTLYRDVQRRYADVSGDAMGIKGDPVKLERMLLATGGDQTRDMVGIAYLEMEAGSLNGLPPSRRGYGALRQPMDRQAVQDGSPAVTQQAAATTTTGSSSSAVGVTQQQQGIIAQRRLGSPGGAMG